MTYTIICSCTDGICQSGCNHHCNKYWNTKTIAQAQTMKHVHVADHENHMVEVRHNGVLIK